MFKKPLLAAVIVLTVSAAASPQVQGRLMGVVKDSQGNPVEKASVHVVSTRTTTVSYDLTTNKEGRFHQVGIQPGYFQVTVKKDGYTPKTTEARVGLDDETKLEFKLDTVDEIALKSVSAADKVFLKGNKLYGDQKYAEAAAAYEEAVGMSQTNWGYYLNLGLTYKKLDKRPNRWPPFAGPSRSAPRATARTRSWARPWPGTRRSTTPRRTTRRRSISARTIPTPTSTWAPA